MKIQLKGRAIPRNEGGDPAFRWLERKDTPQDMTEYERDNWRSVLEVFTKEEVVELVNRALYQLEYQHHAHKVRGQAQRDREKRVKDKVKQLFHVSWMKATPEQIQRATEEVEKE